MTGAPEPSACCDGAVGSAQPHQDAGSSFEVATLEIAGQACRLLCVDDVLPRHVSTRNAARPRLSYAAGEVAHFELGGHSFSLVTVAGEPAAAPRSAAGEAPQDIHDLLTNRELQIVQLISMGCLSKQVADRLHISEFTVRSYLKTIYCKLGVRSRGAMVYRYAQAFRRSGTG